MVGSRLKWERPFPTVLGADCSHDLPVDASRLARLVAAAPSDYPQLLVYHSPELMPEAAEHGIDLYVCGWITHGGCAAAARRPNFTSSLPGRRFVMGCIKSAVPPSTSAEASAWKGSAPRASASSVPRK
ncbi:MAG: hypothetical protein R3D55_11300 [Chloroflexota bacterium]